ncbi:MAG TPA: GGDEF domain-containing protein, partial [Paracoccus sp. (in: a-proteobacteria)]|nr:GGDEF domain-containing protein [Paracoccus sp. (in: a-proteobacteria)]
GGGAMLNLGFGIGLAEAVRRFSLTDRDFPPSDLAMELLFLHEANGAMMAELARYNLRMEQARLAAEAQAFTDPLTGLYNRRALVTALDHAVLAARAPMGRPFALLHLDLDLFKAINDDHGHAAGDHVLRTVAERMTAATRADDTIARMGGDEFLLLLPGLADERQLLQLGQRIIDRIEAPVAFGDVSCRVSASAGVAISTRYVQPDPELMQHDADAALYRAKGEGRGCVRIAPGSVPATLTSAPLR